MASAYCSLTQSEPKREDGFARARTGGSLSLTVSLTFEVLGRRSEFLNVGDFGDLMVFEGGGFGRIGANNRDIWDILCETLSSTAVSIGDGGSAVVTCL